jgi:ATP-binding cassette subfamily F protein uup
MVITHDRVFLDHVATRIVELDRGKLVSFPGRFAAYQERKEFMLNEEEKANARFDKLLAQEEVWIRKGVEARRTRNEGRVRAWRPCAASARRGASAGQGRSWRVDRGDAAGSWWPSSKTSASALRRRATRSVVRDFSCRILRGDKVGLIGPNGAGKTTLLRLILGELEPMTGKVRRAPASKWPTSTSSAPSSIRRRRWPK